MKHHLVILLSAALVNNFTLVMFLGLCSFLGVTKKVATAVRLGIADTFVLVITSIAATVLNRWVLAEAPYLRVIAFIVVIASMVQITEMVIKKFSPKLFRELGIYLPLITTNCAILALALFQTNRGYGFLEGLTFSIGAGIGLTIALSLMASLRERLEFADIPTIARGAAMVLFIASFLSMAFMGFAGLLTGG
ncbi:MAG TPA: Rnf-Nqr domain containing protein [Gemmatimonadaceae bacterium]|nr:Rnf-Nqr domain containing protein [Gemmatimonadaceae bacterium]